MSDLSDAVAKVSTDVQANTQAIADEQTSITGSLNQLAADLEAGNTDVPAAVTQLKTLATQLESNTAQVTQNATDLSAALAALAPPAGGDGGSGDQPQS